MSKQLNWTKLRSKERVTKERATDGRDVANRINAITREEKAARKARNVKDLRMAIIIAAARKHGVFQGPLSPRPLLAPSGAPEDIQRIKHAKVQRKNLSHEQSDDSYFKRMKREW
jgi:hypothetical protein